MTPWEKEEHMDKKEKTAFQGSILPVATKLAVGKSKLFEGMTPEERREMANLLAMMPPKPRE